MKLRFHSMLRRLPLVALAVAAGVVTGHAQIDGTQLWRWVLAGGAVEASQSPAVTLRATVGQPAVGSPTGASTGATVGFWQPGGTVVSVPDDETPAIPDRTRLLQNRPNPFNPATTIRFDLAEPGRTTLRVFDLRGRQVAELLDEELPAGRHRVEFRPDRLASGVYFYELRHADLREVRRLTLVK